MEGSSLKAAVSDVLAQGCALLNAISPEQYRRQQGGPNGSSVGSHYRHILDHFSCLLDGMASGRIDYDQRQRNPVLENSIDDAVQATESLRARFHALPDETLTRECNVIYSVGYGDHENQPVPSNLAREVMFCVGHAIHHFAILKLLCAKVELPYEFGVAPSTLKHIEAYVAP
jgi:uncharacterized damage-inducible protein DinB